MTTDMGFWQIDLVRSVTMRPRLRRMVIEYQTGEIVTVNRMRLKTFNNWREALRRETDLTPQLSNKCVEVWQ